MFQFFKVNDPFRIIGVAFFLLLWTVLYLFFSNDILTKTQLSWMVLGERLSDGFLLYQEILDDTAPLSAGIFMWINRFFGRNLLVYEILGRLLIIFQVILWNRTMIRYRVFAENTYLPAIILLSLFHMSFDMLSLSPALLGSTFLILALSQLFSQTVLQKESSESTLLIGIYGGLATGFHTIYILFLPFLIVVGIAISGFSFRQLMLSLTGYFLPILLISVYYFWMDGLESYIEIWPLFLKSKPYLYQPLEWIGLLLAFPLLLAFLGYFIGSLASSATINQQKQRQIMIFWLLFAGSSLFFSKRQASYQLVILLPVLSYLITRFFLVIQKKIIIQISFFALVVLLPVITWQFFGNNDSVQENYRVKAYKASLPADKSILILGDEIGAYLNHRLGGPFLNYHLSKVYLDQDKDLTQRAHLFELIHSQQPQLVLDPNGDFGKLLEQYPELKRNYRRISTGVFEWE
ncbi:hypothetical protein E4S40_04815 [Algoriphagus kandeliae]|uniref:Glycosyltransferase RgtA/B/C/D-like domain-containing protein n=1 Tax=Algoriphagus kandeliae TaxID=2562278 RepID=A0A4Y9QST0_9BACT|nr:hypothetical protein [Algoriphagus kandeliae]TFV95544.1 hypothetical protein E4S40_04815 [Algoriphagus kandeliae]